MWNKFLLFSFCCVCLAGCSPDEPAGYDLPYYADASFTPHWLDAGDLSLDEFHQISPFSLLNQLGDSITEKNLTGKVYIADFFFTACPGICPKMTTNMAVLQDSFRFNPEVMLLSHSVTPKYDSVSVLMEYAEAKGVKADKWWLLTGDRDQIYRLGRKDYFVEEDLGQQKEKDDFLHTENFVLIDQNRHIRGIYNGLNKASVNQLILDVRTLLSAK
ncbi:SCO family protein [Neolewinella agarilytica]|uniref:Protein SCO1/2 n=1 Tax=Neolewinella agarilytica TaxID=478744 RepID=A0A1H9DM04_9BACT|nr:SCO family protein [Neolewinella agarilytica]SEQ14504.1 protein SCO1/2 [Neolewinella agarilytica]